MARLRHGRWRRNREDWVPVASASRRKPFDTIMLSVMTQRGVCHMLPTTRPCVGREIVVVPHSSALPRGCKA